jgi:hypothetical protein
VNLADFSPFLETHVQATPAVGFASFILSPDKKVPFLLFIKNNKKCKTMKFLPKH